MDDRKNLRDTGRGKDGDKACAGKRPLGGSRHGFGLPVDPNAMLGVGRDGFAGRSRPDNPQPGELSGASAPQLHEVRSFDFDLPCLEASSDFATGQIQCLAQAAKRLQSTGLGIARGL